MERIAQNLQESVDEFKTQVAESERLREESEGLRRKAIGVQSQMGRILFDQMQVGNVSTEFVKLPNLSETDEHTKHYNFSSLSPYLMGRAEFNDSRVVVEKLVTPLEVPQLPEVTTDDQPKLQIYRFRYDQRNKHHGHRNHHDDPPPIPGPLTAMYVADAFIKHDSFIGHEKLAIKYRYDPSPGFNYLTLRDVRVNGTDIGYGFKDTRAVTDKLNAFSELLGSVNLTQSPEQPVQ